jgi:uncharacterized Rmd1/YagE family protein
MTRAARTLPVTTVALDAPVEPAELSGLLSGSPRTPHPSGLEIALSGEKRLFIYHFGALVVVGAAELDDALIAEVERATRRAPLPRTVDTYTFLIGGDAPGQGQGRVRVDWDQIVLPEDRPELIVAACLLLAQSAALERFEGQADALLDEALVMTRALRDSGKPPRNTRALVSRVGHITTERLAMSAWFYLEDRPEPTWRDPQVAGLYDALFDNLEMDARRKAMLHKLEEVEAATQAVIDLAHGRTSHLLEWAVVLLIVLEVVLGFFPGH